MRDPLVARRRGRRAEASPPLVAPTWRDGPAEPNPTALADAVTTASVATGARVSTALPTRQQVTCPTGELPGTDLPDRDRRGAARPRTSGPRPDCSAHFIGTFVDGPGLTTAVDQAEIVLRGDLDAQAVRLVGEHIAALLRTSVRFLSINAVDVDRVDPALLDLLSRTQRRLGSRRGMVAVHGLHPSRVGPDKHTR